MKEEARSPMQIRYHAVVPSHGRWNIENPVGLYREIETDREYRIYYRTGSRWVFDEELLGSIIKGDMNDWHEIPEDMARGIVERWGGRWTRPRYSAPPQYREIARELKRAVTLIREVWKDVEIPDVEWPPAGDPDLVGGCPDDRDRFPATPDLPSPSPERKI